MNNNKRILDLINSSIRTVRSFLIHSEMGEQGRSRRYKNKSTTPQQEHLTTLPEAAEPVQTEAKSR